MQNALSYLKYTEIVQHSKASINDVHTLTESVKSAMSKEVIEKLRNLDEFSNLYHPTDMDIYIVDANVIFSAILNDKSRIGTFIQTVNQYDVVLYAPEILRVEIHNHRNRIIEISEYTVEEYLYVRDRLYRHIEFVDDDVIPFEEFIKAMRLVRDIDPDDVHFVALSNYLNKTRWIGDIRLYEGLRDKGYDRVVTFQQLRDRYAS